jgi:integrase
LTSSEACTCLSWWIVAVTSAAAWYLAHGCRAEAYRDRVLFETAYVCGARASEVCGLDVEDQQGAGPCVGHHCGESGL